MNVSRECTEFILNSKMNYIKNKSNILNDKKNRPKSVLDRIKLFVE